MSKHNRERKRPWKFRLVKVAELRERLQLRERPRPAKVVKVDGQKWVRLRRSRARVRRNMLWFAAV